MCKKKKAQLKSRFKPNKVLKSQLYVVSQFFVSILKGKLRHLQRSWRMGMKGTNVQLPNSGK